MGLGGLIAGRRVIVCVGPGGVGKTTISAAIGALSARAGRRTLVLTVDPARRLATALGLDPSASGPRRVEGPWVSGALEVEMLDARRTLDELLARFAPDAAARARLEENALLRHLGAAVSGAQSYLAMERLHQLLTGPHELLVVDTPPSASAYDFVTAPQRMVAVLDSPLLAALSRADGGGRALGRLAWLTGREIFEGLGALAGDLGGMFAGFGERARLVASSLRDESCAFLVVTAPTAAAVDEAADFERRLGGAGLRFEGFVVNGAQPSFGPPARPEALAARLGEEACLAVEPSADLLRLAEGLSRAQAAAQALAEREARVLAPLSSRELARAPRRPQDIRDVAGVLEVAASL